VAVVESSRVVAPRSGVIPADRGFRPEVQGLRALAVLMVVTYHVWFGRVSGGVDVFLLISAFLLALSFLRKVESGKPLDLARHWLHQFKRLLPAVVVVILGTLGATYLLVPQSRWPDVIEQAWASLFYLQNWVLASNAVDYYADDHSLASPLQHFWSLSVQGQVFILWPLLFLASALLARRFRLKFRGVVLLVFGALFVGSLTFSVWETATNQAYAYFDTRARLWEFAVGTLLALALPFIRLPRILRVVAGWTGVAAMLSGGFLLDVQGQFPGYVALWPLAAAALVIIAGHTSSPFGVDRFLSSKPLVRMGDLSYALYLWHWPVLVLALVWQDRASPGLVGGLIVIVASLVLAHLTMRFVERPLRALAWADRRRRRAAIVLAAGLGLVVAPLTVWQEELRNQSERIIAESVRNNPGAQVFEAGYDDQSELDAPLIPLLAEVRNDWPRFDGDCKTDEAESISECSNSIPTDSERDIFVVGSSHALTWTTPFLQMAKDERWSLTSFTKGYCPLTLEPSTEEACLEHNRRAIERILERRPDVVVTNSTQTSFDGNEVLDRTWLDIVERFTDAGIEVIAIRDTPRLPSDAPTCIENTSAPHTECGVAREATLNDQALPDVGSDPAIHFLDMTAYFCQGDFCPAVIGNVIVYKDSDHVTSSYMRTLSSALKERLPQTWF
jgi:peptidoglycan/LPS O-acetylase OafA/YrhL